MDDMQDIWGTNRNEKTIDEVGGEILKNKLKRKNEKDIFEPSKVASMQTIQDHQMRVHAMGAGASSS